MVVAFIVIQGEAVCDLLCFLSFRLNVPQCRVAFPCGHLSPARQGARSRLLLGQQLVESLIVVPPPFDLVHALFLLHLGLGDVHLVTRKDGLVIIVIIVVVLAVTAPKDNAAERRRWRRRRLCQCCRRCCHGCRPDPNPPAARRLIVAEEERCVRVLVVIAILVVIVRVGPGEERHRGVDACERPEGEGARSPRRCPPRHADDCVLCIAREFRLPHGGCPYLLRLTPAEAAREWPQAGHHLDGRRHLHAVV
mmetsp:Transcript_63420/g.200585  ORF Transcript_63420/g.200585 Transcript_63420/m.200585 type:complete len:251 (+) Transcript_63420:1582-2334(+)